MKQYSCFQAMFMSFYSRNLYRDVAKNWGAGVILYLFILLFIVWGIMMFQIQPNINQGFRELVNKYGSQMPELTFANGILTTPENKPYMIVNPSTGQPVAIIDTSGQYQNLDSAPKNVGFLLTKTTMFYVDNNQSIREQKIPENFKSDIKPEDIKSFGMKFVGWAWVLILPFLLIGSFLYRLIQALIYAIIGKIFGAVSGSQLSYSEILKLSMIAVTPAIVLATILDMCMVVFHFQFLLYFIISMIYLFFAISANKIPPATNP